MPTFSKDVNEFLKAVIILTRAISLTVFSHTYIKHNPNLNSNSNILVFVNLEMFLTGFVRFPYELNVVIKRV